MKKKGSINRREVILGVGAALSGIGLSALTNVEAQTSQVKADYSLQTGIRGLRVPSTLTIVGTGRLGSWAALFAAISGVQRLILLDPATVDAKDVATTPFKLSQIGKPKVEAAREIVLDARPDASVVIHQQLFVAEKDAQLLEGAVINGASDQNLRRLLPTLAQKKGLHYAAGGYSGLGVAVMDSFPSTSQIAESDSPVWAGSAALSAILTIYGVFVAPINFAGEISRLNVPKAKVNATFKAFGSEKP